MEEPSPKASRKILTSRWTCAGSRHLDCRDPGQVLPNVGIVSNALSLATQSQARIEVYFEQTTPHYAFRWNPLQGIAPLSWRHEMSLHVTIGSRRPVCEGR